MKNPNHIAFIMDGNRRWAKKNNLPTTQGHQYGLKAMKEIINECIKKEIKNISFFCFSTENWNRNEDEVYFLMKIISKEIENPKLKEWLEKTNIKFIWNGFEDKLNQKLVKKLKELMLLTRKNTGTKLQLCLNYGSQQKIIEAINQIKDNDNEITIKSIMNYLDIGELGVVDLLIRTSGEKRISNFLLFEIAYAELIFNEKYWPEYRPENLQSDLDKFYRRQRRYGG